MIDSNKNSSRGFSLIELLIVVAIIGVIAAIAIPNLIASRRAANEGSAVSSLRVIFGAQATYRATEGNGFYADNLGELNTSGIVDRTLGCGADPCLKSGYYFDVNKQDGSPASHPPLWNVYATPLTSAGAMQTGSYSYYTNEVGTIYFKLGGAAPTAGISTTVRSPSDGSPLGN